MTKHEYEINASVEKMRRRASIIALIFGYIGAIGLAFAVMTILEAQMYADFVTNDELLTDPSIPYSERENATYTITPEYLESRIESITQTVILGVSIFGIGFSCMMCVFWLRPYNSRLAYHEQFCTEGYQVQYCDGCGAKLADLSVARIRREERKGRFQ